MTSTAGGSAGLAWPQRLQTRARASKTSTRGRRASNTLDGHEQGASGFVNDGPGVLIVDVHHENSCAGTCCTGSGRRGRARRLGLAGALLGQTQPGHPLCTAAMRARANGSLFTNWIDRECAETGAGVGGGGQPRFDVPEE